VSLLVAAALGVPSMGVYLAPVVPTNEFAMPGSGPPGADAGATDHRSAGRRVIEGARTVYADILPALARRLRLPAESVEEVWGRWMGASGWPISHGFSPAVVRRPSDWPDSVDVVGSWWPARSGGGSSSSRAERNLLRAALVGSGPALDRPACRLVGRVGGGGDESGRGTALQREPLQHDSAH
jgi:sterol 3beta-glucosyltransferase